MKHILQSLLVGLLLLCLLLPTGTAFALTEDELPGVTVNGEPVATHMDPVNPNASQEAKNMLYYLQSLNDTNRFVTGTFDISTSDSMYQLIKEQFDTEVGFYSARYQVAVTENTVVDGVSYELCDFYDQDKVNALFKQHYDNGNMLLIHADTCVEDYLAKWMVENGIADNADNGIIHLDETNPDRNMYMYSTWMLYQDNLIEALGKLEASGVGAYLYRPWVEFDRFVFNGVDEEGYAILRRVWQQTSDYMCASGLTGFLLTWAPCSAYSLKYDRYPGNEYLDVVSVTLYSELPSPTPGEGGALEPNRFKDYSWAIKTGKPVGLSETSCRTGNWQEQGLAGRQSWYNTLTSMLTYWPKITWVNCWGDGSYSLVNESEGSTLNGNDDGYWYVNSPYSITLDELPDYRTLNLTSPGVVQLYTDVNYAGNGKGSTLGGWYGLEEKTYTYKDLKALGLDPTKIASFHINAGYGMECFTTDDATGESWRYLGSKADTTAMDSAGKIRSIRIFTPKNVALNKYEIYASDNDADAWKANDGFASRWTGIVDKNGQGWLMIDLEKVHVINRWVVQHAGSAGEAELYNTVDFCLQYSLDGKTWVTTDTVTDNTASITDRTLTSMVEARYFRLLITNPSRVTAGLDVGRMTIAEWELYGIESNLAVDDTPKENESETDTETETDAESDTQPESDTDVSSDAEVESNEDIDSQPDDVEDEDTFAPDEDTFVPDEDITDDETDEPDDSDVMDEDDESGNKRKPIKVITTVPLLPWWGWMLIAVGSLLIAAAVLILVLVIRRKKKATIEAE